jgi:hypothetical protein
MRSRAAKKDLLDITWEGEVVGQVEDLKVDNYHLYGKWIPAASPKAAELEARLQEEEHMILVEIGHGPPPWIATAEAIERGMIEMNVWRGSRR